VTAKVIVVSLCSRSTKGRPQDEQKFAPWGL
jgi:hypothetical protein